MMAKMFYTMEEAKVALGKGEEDIKQLAREGRLREFRDGPRLMFKADQVEQLKAELVDGGGMGGDAINLGPSDTGAIGLMDSRSSTGSSISLVDPESSAGGLHADTGAGVDIGLSGSVGGVPSPGRISESRSGTRAGSVFDVDDGQKVDASAQTTIGSGIQDQINLESVGSGSGLLDLTRERDDTSLGAVFDELGSAGGSAAGSAPAPVGHAPAAMGSLAGVEEVVSPLAPMSQQPMIVEAPDHSAPAFGAMALAAAGIVGFGAFILAASLFEVQPAILKTIYDGGPMYFLLGAAVVGVFALVGFLVGKVGSK